MSLDGSFDVLPDCIGRCGEGPDTVLYILAGENRIALADHVPIVGIAPSAAAEGNLAG
jgi:hypothetical protein